MDTSFSGFVTVVSIRRPLKVVTRMSGKVHTRAGFYLPIFLARVSGLPATINFSAPWLRRDRRCSFPFFALLPPSPSSSWILYLGLTPERVQCRILPSFSHRIRCEGSRLLIIQKWKGRSLKGRYKNQEEKKNNYDSNTKERICNKILALLTR